VDDPRNLGAVLGALQAVSRELPVVLPLHPRTRKNVDAFGLADRIDGIHVMEPVGYREMQSLSDGAAVVLTDSGGLQEETTYLGVPCVTLREQTERPVTVTEGTNRMAPWPLTAEGVFGAAQEARAQGRLPAGSRVPEGWDGRAAERIVAALARA
jgi:UDP-N-acetylglucosamine 2-epimerase (non-hydrolysing)